MARSPYHLHTVFIPPAHARVVLRDLRAPCGALTDQNGAGDLGRPGATTIMPALGEAGHMISGRVSAALVAAVVVSAGVLAGSVPVGPWAKGA